MRGQKGGEILFSWGDAKHCLTELSQEKTIFPVGPVKGDRQACGTARGRNALRVRRNFLPANDGNGIVVVDASLISASVVNLNGKKPGAPVNTASDVRFVMHRSARSARRITQSWRVPSRFEP